MSQYTQVTPNFNTTIINSTIQETSSSLNSNHTDHNPPLKPLPSFITSISTSNPNSNLSKNPERINKEMGEEEMADPARGYTSPSYALSGKIMLSAIVILFTVVLLIICLHIYARCFLIRARRRHNNLRRRTHRRTTHLVFISDTAPSSQPLSVTNNTPVFVSRGLEPSVLKSLPTFIYSTANKTAAAQDEEEVLECAVCLSEFEENEKGRLLPKCNHSFHIDCIDMWFHTHSTCPICRAPVNNPQISEPEKTDEIPSIQIVIESSESEPGSSSSSSEPCPCCLHEEIVNGVPSSSTSTSSSDLSSGLNPPSLSVGARRKISELVGVSIEVPRREESFGEEIQSGSPGSQGYKSPGSRILSLKRILSREKKPSSIPSLSFCGSVSEIDPEKGVEEDEAAHTPTVQVNR